MRKYAAQRLIRFASLLFALLLGLAGAPLAQTHWYGVHLTEAAPWVTTLHVHNNGDAEAPFTLTVRGADGTPVHQEEYVAPGRGAAVLVFPTGAGYAPGPGEVLMTPVEGTFEVTAASGKVRPRVCYRYGSTPSVSEFFLRSTWALEYLLPNTVQSHFSWAGVAMMNPGGNPLVVTLTAFRGGTARGETTVTVGPGAKYVRLSTEIWAGLGYTDFDHVRVSAASPFPPPITIVGNTAQDRHVYFNGEATDTDLPPAGGTTVAVDPIAGNLRCVPAGTFTQGSTGVPCQGMDEGAFTHRLTRSVAMMETEVTRGMWAALRVLRPSLPEDPCGVATSPDHPLVEATWYEAVLFANLLSLERGLTPCYYTDASRAVPIDATNYADNDAVHCAFDAPGYRLPTEGEWECACRAGTTTPFFVPEPGYTTGNCSQSSVAGMYLVLETVVRFKGNSGGAGTPFPVGELLPNAWSLYDLSGNVSEWVWDRYEWYPSGSLVDYTGPAGGSMHTTRGGCWESDARHVRSSSRGSTNRYMRHEDVGFRLVRTMP
ncbi:MAG: formylglycine-generating enzyme family protein [Acidobacteria bacterium]|nr:formylglycine-generating enzyme family protein [Acidobacteriota bacterium]